MKTASEVAEEFVRRWLYHPEEKVIQDYIDIIAQSLTAFREEGIQEAYSEVPDLEAIIKKARAEGYAKAREEAAKVVDPIWAWKSEPQAYASYTTKDMRNYHIACAEKIRALREKP